MTIVLNGKSTDFEEPVSVSELLERLEVPTLHVAVEVNARVIPRGAHEATVLRHGDRIEIVSFVGGG